jgi:hypothetical protein
VVANPAPSLPSLTGRASEYKTCYQEMSIRQEMVQVDRLLAEIAELTGATVALSFCKRLTQPIQERVHPGYEYWGSQPDLGAEITRSPGRMRRTESPASLWGRSGTRAAQKPTT